MKSPRDLANSPEATRLVRSSEMTRVQNPEVALSRIAKRRAARRRLLISNMMIAYQAAINASFDLRR